MNKKKQKKLIFETKRKAVHILGLGYVLVYWIAQRIFSHLIAMIILISSLIFFLVIEYFRIKEKRKFPFDNLFRPKEENSLGGQVYFLLGIIIALAIFEFRIALAVILMMVLGDMAAAVFGIAFGRHWLKSVKNRAWEGIIAEFVVDVIVGYAVLGNFLIVIPMAITATLVETIFSHVDDNLAIPIFAGFVGQGLSLIF
jgi:phytol kinase